MYCLEQVAYSRKNSFRVLMGLALITMVAAAQTPPEAHGSHRYELETHLKSLSSVGGNIPDLD